MSRQVRRVPPNWEHPKNERGEYIPLYGRSFREVVEEWDKHKQQWDKGFYFDYNKDEWSMRGPQQEYTFEEWWGHRPTPQEKDLYMPDWSDDKRTHYQMYQIVTEGTPISPVMATPEALARWLVDNKASTFLDRTATYEQWLAMIKGGGYAPTAFFKGSESISGVEFLGGGSYKKQQKTNQRLLKTVVKWFIVLFVSFVTLALIRLLVL